MQADLWSVGAILYQLVVGRPPFDGNSQLQVVKRLNSDDILIFIFFYPIFKKNYSYVFLFFGK